MNEKAFDLKDMDFEWALRKLRWKIPVRRFDWTPGWHLIKEKDKHGEEILKLKDIKSYIISTNFPVSSKDILAEDWELF